MKAIILIISVIISIIGLIVGQFLYPLIASWFNGYPMAAAAIVLGLLFVIITFPTWVLTKDKWIRSFILIPFFVCALVTEGLLYLRFDDDCYRNGYCYTGGKLKNSLGLTFIDSSCSYYWYRGFNEWGDEVFVNVNCDDDWRNNKQNFEIMVFDTYGDFRHDKSFTINNNKDGEKFYNFYNLNLTRQFLKKHTGITIYQEIG